MRSSASLGPVLYYDLVREIAVRRVLVATRSGNGKAGIQAAHTGRRVIVHAHLCYRRQEKTRRTNSTEAVTRA